MTSGIYAIRNRNGRIYVGRSVSICDRWNNHISSLMAGQHLNRALQIDFDRYGLEGLTFSVLELCPPENLKERERHHILLLRISDYNVSLLKKPTQRLRAPKVISEADAAFKALAASPPPPIPSRPDSDDIAERNAFAAARLNRERWFAARFLTFPPWPAHRPPTDEEKRAFHIHMGFEQDTTPLPARR